jgi:hypothetical protein
MRICLAPILNFVLFHWELCLNITIGENFFDWTIMGGELRLFRVVFRLSGTKLLFIF